MMINIFFPHSPDTHTLHPPLLLCHPDPPLCISVILTLYFLCRSSYNLAMSYLHSVSFFCGRRRRACYIDLTYISP